MSAACIPFGSAFSTVSIFRPCLFHSPSIITHAFSVSASISASMASSAKKKVLVPVGFGSEESETVVIVDILRRAGADVLLASVEQELQIEASRQVKLVADEKIESCHGQNFDLIALPGGMPGSSHLRDCTILKDLTVSHAQQGKLIAAICAAPVVALQDWGLLEGRKATCHPSFNDKAKFSLSLDSRVQKDGNFITSQGPGTAMEFALVLVEHLYGRQKHDEVYKPLVLRSNTGNELSKENLNSQQWKADGAPRVLVPIANGSEEMEAVIIIDVLRRAGMHVVVASVENELQIEASRKVKIVADELIQDVDGLPFDLIVLPGGMPGAERLRDCATLKNLLVKQAEGKRAFGAICAAPAVVLETYGLLKERKATCHPAFSSKLSDQSSVDSRVVVDGISITSRGPGTAMEFALSIIEQFHGEEKAANIAKPMVFQYPL